LPELQHSSSSDHESSDDDGDLHRDWWTKSQIIQWPVSILIGGASYREHIVSRWFSSVQRFPQFKNFPPLRGFPLSWDFASTFIQSKLFAQIRLTAFGMWLDSNVFLSLNFNSSAKVPFLSF
jgi:hypothetical protein